MHIATIIPQTLHSIDKINQLLHARLPLGQLVRHSLYGSSSVTHLFAGSMQLLYTAMVVVVAAGCFTLVAAYMITAAKKMLPRATGVCCTAKAPVAGTFRQPFILFRHVSVASHNIGRPPPFSI